MQFRTARSDDPAGLAELIYLADLAHYPSSGYALSIGGTREHQLSQISKLVRAKAESPFHFSHFDVAEANGGSTIAACVAGFDKARTDPQMVPALLEIGWSSQEIEETGHRIAPIVDCVPEVPPGTWTIEHVATLPHYRGQGLARQLLERALNRGAALGYVKASLDVFIGNTKARALYAAAGFTHVCEFGHGPMRQYLGRDPVERMGRSLVGWYN
ncbi:MAG TPA: GNAT family N-acetyltransferase [Bryobacteraceae bacterium]|jgi:ribosomal protein S18 acetylase RimI-like enzyme